jgi:hypothetical protein
VADNPVRERAIFLVEEEIARLHLLQQLEARLQLELMLNPDQKHSQLGSVRTVQGLAPQLRAGQTVQPVELITTHCLELVLFVQEGLAEVDLVGGYQVHKVKAVEAEDG